MQREQFRAKRLDNSDYLISDGIRWINDELELRDNSETMFDSWIPCDDTTRSVSYPDMLDSEGNRIFASFSENGNGGDILEWSIFPDNDNEKRINGIPFYSRGGVFKITDRIEMLWHNLAPHRKCKVTGIQDLQMLNTQKK